MKLLSSLFFASCFNVEILAFSFTRSKCEVNKRELVRALGNNDKKVSSLYRLDSHGEPERICPAGYNLIWDMTFCMKVCGLQAGDQCVRTIQSGVDICDQDANLECIYDDYRSDRQSTCQPLVTFDSSSSSSSLSYYIY
ncbi:unnamed protein product [Oikopleura dioica]|uniref:Secreted protein n=1 Tax=Oikopleura dioica TaxID=34765 RepID=E4XZI6_OIKDI|nr:unnamed protein product [Oikopleura dioica]